VTSNIGYNKTKQHRNIAITALKHQLKSSERSTSTLNL